MYWLVVVLLIVIVFVSGFCIGIVIKDDDDEH